MKNLKTIFHSNSIFHNCSAIELSKLCQYTKEIKVKKGDEIYKIDESLDFYYLIISGEVELISSDNTQTLMPGNSFGDEAILGLEVSFSNASAKTNTTLLCIEKDAMIHLDTNITHPKIQNNLLNNIGKTHQINDPVKNVEVKKPYIANTIKWLATIIFPFLIIYYLSQLDIPPTDDQSLLIYLFFSAVFMWYFRLVPEFVPALYLLLGMVLLSLAPSHIVLSGFYSNTFFLAISLAALAVIIQISGLSYRILLYLFYHLGSHKFWQHFALFLSGAILTPIIPSANSRANIAYPLFKEAMSLTRVKRGSVEYQRFIASTIGGFSLLSPIFLTSKSINLIALGMLSVQDQYNFQFYYWFVSAAVVGGILLLFYAFFSWLVFRNNSPSKINNKSLKEQIHILGKITVIEIFAASSIAIFTIIVLASNVHNVSIAWLAMLLIVFLFILGTLKRTNFNQSIDWDFLMFLSALLGFASTLNYLEMDVWINHYVLWIPQIIEQSFIAFVAILSVIIFVMRLILPINISVILLASILVPVANSTGVNAWLIIFIILLMSENYTYNVSASYVIQFLYLIREHRTYPRIFWLQVIVYIVKFLAIIASIPYWNYLGLLTKL